jgi:hypothetical protein
MAAAALLVSSCSSTLGFDDPSADYLQRTALVSTTGGDAQAANLALQTPTPWPRYSNDTNIPGNGARMTAAIKRYESGAASAGESSGQTSTNPGGSSGSGAGGNASTGMTTSPASPSPGY